MTDHDDPRMPVFDSIWDRASLHEYRVNDVYVSVQGEGAQTGIPMVVVRLQGCPVGCVFCDTKETWHDGIPGHQISGGSAATRLGQLRHGEPDWTAAAADELAAYCRESAPALTWILLTGGEPAEQELAALIKALHHENFRVAIETSGTAIGHLDPRCRSGPFAAIVAPSSLADWTCVSPKWKNPGGRGIYAAAIRTADEIKWVVGKAGDVVQLRHFMEEFGIEDWKAVSLQPMSQSAAATQLCLDAAKMYGCRVSIQIHKYINVP